MDEARASLMEGKRNTATLTEHVQTLQSELNQSELRREELEAELNNTKEVRKAKDVTRCAIALTLQKKM